MAGEAVGGRASRRACPSPPEAADAPLELHAPAGRGDPAWHSGTAVVGCAFVAKFAWSRVAAVRTRREGQVLLALRSAAPDLPLPEVAAVGVEPALLVTRVVPGAPLTGAGIAALDFAATERVAADLAAFLARLHDPSVLDAVRRVAPMVAPVPQADTGTLRARFGRWVGAQRRDAVLGWCDWVDAVLERPAPADVLVHGDLHGHNQLWDMKAPALRAVVDFERPAAHGTRSSTSATCPASRPGLSSSPPWCAITGRRRGETSTWNGYWPGTSAPCSGTPCGAARRASPCPEAAPPRRGLARGETAPRQRGELPPAARRQPPTARLLVEVGERDEVASDGASDAVLLRGRPRAVLKAFGNPSRCGVAPRGSPAIALWGDGSPPPQR